jgi:hypothetical protein
MKEPKALAHFYLEAYPDETDEEAMKRLEDFIYFVQEAHPNLTVSIHELETQEI